MSKTGHAKNQEIPFVQQTKGTPSGTSGTGEGNKTANTNSVVQSPVNPAGMDAAKWYGANFNPNVLQSSAATGAMDQYANSRSEASATPMGMANKYNVTGVDARRTSNLSRLVDALNNKSWVATTANQGHGANFENYGGGTVRDLNMPTVETAESRQQRRMEDWQGTAATNELNTRSWLRKMAPQLEMQRQQSILQLEKEMDQTQVHAAISAIDNFFREMLAEFSTNERLRGAAQLAYTLKNLGSDDAIKAVMAQAYGVAAMDYMTQLMQDVGVKMQDAATSGDWATVDNLNRLSRPILNLWPHLAMYGQMENISENAKAFTKKGNK